MQSSKFYLSLLTLLFIGSSAYAQVGIGINNPDASAELHVFSTTRGFLPPVMSESQRNAIANVAEGVMLYCNDCSPEGYYLYSNNAWVSLSNTDAQSISRSGLTVNLTNGGNFQDSVLTETDVDNMVSNNGYLTSFTEVDGSTSNEIQTLSRSGLTLTLDNGGGSVTDSVLTETDVDNMVSNNGYLTSFTEVDGSTTNEIQDLNLSGNTLSIENGNSVDLSSYMDNTVLTESQVDAYANNNGYLTSFTEVDGSTSNELQTISKSGSTVTLSNSGGSFTDDVLTESQVDAYANNNGYLTSFTEVDGSTTNEIQDLSLSGNTLSIENGNSVDLSSYMDNTVLTESQVDAYVADNGYLTAASLPISTDVSLADESDVETPSEKAVKTYVDGSIGAVISTDATLAGNSDAVVPSEKAVKTYIDSSPQLAKAIGTDNYHANLAGSGTMQNIQASATDNLALGKSAISGLTDGQFNIAFGNHALQNVSSGKSNIAIGESSGLSINGSNNTLIGDFAGSNTNGSDNTFIGSNAGEDSQSNGSVFLGSSAGKDEDNDQMLYIENSNSSTPLIGGSFSGNRVGINKATSSLSSGATLQVGGGISLQNGIGIDEFSNDATLAGNSDLAVPTEKAVKTYVDGSVGAVISTDATLAGNSDAVVPSEKAVKNYVDKGSARLTKHDSGNFNYHTNVGSMINLGSGSYNHASGYQTLRYVTSGQRNTAVGYLSSRDIRSGSHNVSMGFWSLLENESGNENTAIGNKAGEQLTSGDYNTFLGGGTGLQATGSGNTFLGAGAGLRSQSNLSVFLGRLAGEYEDRDSLLYIENTSSSTPLIGGDFQANKVGINTDMTNIESGATLQIGGDISLQNGTRVNELSIDGTLAGNSDDVIPTEKAVKTYVDNSVAVISTDGTLASSSSTEVPSEGAVKAYVDNSVAVVSTDGALAGNSSTEVPSESAVKAYVDNNKGIITASTNHYGNHTNMISITTAIHNTALGADAMKSVTTGNVNTATGSNALIDLTGGALNTAFGGFALRRMQTGNSNTSIGANAGRDNVSGNNNVMVGSATGQLATDGSNNTFIGKSAGFSSQTSSSVFLGYSAGYYEDSHDRLYIENSNSTTPLIGGSFAHNVVTINTAIGDDNVFNFNNHASSKDYNLFISGGAYKSTGGSGWNHSSDKRLKTDITYMESKEMLEKVLAMKGVSYVWNDTVTGLLRDDGIQYGFIAQDLQKVWPEKVIDDPYGYLATSYGTYDAMFVEAIRALNYKNESMQQQIEDLKKENSSLKAEKETEMNELKARLDQLEKVLQSNASNTIQVSR